MGLASRYDSNFFAQLVDLQNQVALPTKERDELAEDKMRRQESYIRREAQQNATIEKLQKRIETIESDVSETRN